MPRKTMLNIAQRAQPAEPVAARHPLCAGCGAGVVIRQMLLATDYDVVIANATGCVEVCTSVYPYTAWRVPWIHNGFENAAATVSGAEAAYKAMKRRGHLPPKRDRGRPRPRPGRSE